MSEYTRLEWDDPIKRKKALYLWKQKRSLKFIAEKTEIPYHQLVSGIETFIALLPRGYFEPKKKPAPRKREDKVYKYEDLITEKVNEGHNYKDYLRLEKAKHLG